MKTPEELAREYANTKPDCEYFAAMEGFLAGYQAAKDQLPPFHAGADVHIIDANNPLPKPMPLSIAEQYQFADTSKVMKSPEKSDGRNSSNDSNGWISVRDRLPDKDSTVLIYTEAHDTYMAKIYKDGEAWPISNSCGCCGTEEKFTHWMSLPKPPEKEV